MRGWVQSGDRRERREVREGSRPRDGRGDEGAQGRRRRERGAARSPRELLPGLSRQSLLVGPPAARAGLVAREALGVARLRADRAPRGTARGGRGRRSPRRARRRPRRSARPTRRRATAASVASRSARLRPASRRRVRDERVAVEARRARGARDLGHRPCPRDSAQAARNSASIRRRRGSPGRRAQVARSASSGTNGCVAGGAIGTPSRRALRATFEHHPARLGRNLGRPELPVRVQEPREQHRHGLDRAPAARARAAELPHARYALCEM